jgi:uncharacterized protein YbaP (TraB family)
MRMLAGRREILFLLSAGAACAASRGVSASADPAIGAPILWTVRRGKGKVHLFGFADAKDRSWLTPAIDRAFQESSQIWFESPHPDPSANDLPKSTQNFRKQFGYDQQHSIFDLDASVSSRLLKAAVTYGVPRETLEHTRPWLAYFVLNNGYWAYRTKKGLGAVEDSPDATLATMAWKSPKQVLSECPTYDDQLFAFIDMPDQVAIERLVFLLDYLDDEEAGRNADRFDWISGSAHPPRTIDRMRLNMPALYEYEHIRRNKIWALRIDKLLSFGGVYFIAIGMNHLLGPESILVRLKEKGLEPVSTR